MIHTFFILLLYLLKCSSDHVKVVQAGDSVTFTCVLSRDSRANVVWVKQQVGEKAFAIVTSFKALTETFENDFYKNKRFSVAKDDSSFNLSITNVEKSDTATYYCVHFMYKFTFGNRTDLIVKAGSVSLDSVSPSDSAALRCSVLTPHCAGGHNVYWFRHESGESPPGIIYTQEQRNAQCERSSELNNTQNKCFYSLPRTNNSLQDDTGIYSCAVAACGQILFGDARKLDLTGFQTPWNTTSMVSIILHCLSITVIIFLGIKLYKHWRKDGTQNIQIGHLTDEDRSEVNYAALSFQQKSSTSRRPRENIR